MDQYWDLPWPWPAVGWLLIWAVMAHTLALTMRGLLAVVLASGATIFIAGLGETRAPRP